MAKILIAGGAGFMGRWVSKYLLGDGHKVWVLDNLSNSTEDNIGEFRDKLEMFVKGDIKNKELLAKLLKNNFDICIHLAAAINVQESIDNPEKCFNNNVVGTFNLLEECRKNNSKMVFVSSALIYGTSNNGRPITEDHPLNSSCPYTASKIFGENLTISYYKTYNLPTVILRPFSVYGPWQKSDSEGGVMSIFIERKLRNQPLEVFGDGKQSRDFFYIEDCADFVIRAAFSDKANGQIFNAGFGQETRIGDLAKIIAANSGQIRFVKHRHPHAEVMSMCADSGKAKKILGWQSKTKLEEGIEKTKRWLKSRQKT